MKTIVGLTPQESAPQLRYLIDHATQDAFCYRHQWRVHDLLVWDNRCTMHRAVGDYDRNLERNMERCTIIGTRCGELYDGPLELDAITER